MERKTFTDILLCFIFIVHISSMLCAAKIVPLFRPQLHTLSIVRRNMFRFVRLFYSSRWCFHIYTYNIALVVPTCDVHIIANEISKQQQQATNQLCCLGYCSVVYDLWLLGMRFQTNHDDHTESLLREIRRYTCAHWIQIRPPHCAYSNSGIPFSPGPVHM